MQNGYEGADMGEWPIPGGYALSRGVGGEGGAALAAFWKPPAGRVLEAWTSHPPPAQSSAFMEALTLSRKKAFSPIVRREFRLVKQLHI